MHFVIKCLRNTYTCFTLSYNAFYESFKIGVSQKRKLGMLLLIITEIYIFRNIAKRSAKFFTSVGNIIKMFRVFDYSFEKVFLTNRKKLFVLKCVYLKVN